MKKNELKEPPIGVIPELIWKERRLLSLNKAISEYNEAKIKPLSSWTKEKTKLEKEIASLRKKPLS